MSEGVELHSVVEGGRASVPERADEGSVRRERTRLERVTLEVLLIPSRKVNT